MKNFFVLIILSCLLISACSSQESRRETTLSGGKLVRSTVSDPKSFNSIVAKETSTTAIVGNIFEGLTRTNGATLEVEPNLAEKWEVSKDGLTWMFYLRKDVVWSDAKPFTAADVVFTFNQLIYNSDIPTSARDIFTIEGKQFNVTAVDTHTVKFKLPVKFAPFLRSMSQEILPKHILEKYVDAGTFNSTWGLGTPPEQIVGTGPFKLSGYLPGQRIELVKNNLYWRFDEEGRRLPYLERLIYLIVPNQDVALLKFQDGEIDSYGLRGTDFPILKPQEKEKNFTIYNTGPAFGTNFLVFNQNRGKNERTGKPYVGSEKLRWFTNKDFRKAVAYALDRESMVDIVMNGLGWPQYAAMSPSSGFFYNPNVKKYGYDPDRAKELLAEIGFTDKDGDGYLEDDQGNALEFSLYTNSGNDVRVKIANIIRKDLENLGFKIHFMQLEFNALVAKLDSTYDWDAVLLGLTGGIEPHFGSNVWQSSGHLHMWYPVQKEAATEWEREIDELFNKGVQELDKNKRKVYYDKWQLIVSTELPFIYAVLPASIFAVRNKFGNLNPTPYGGAFHNLEEIYIKK